MTNESTELDVYRPHLAELGRQDSPSEMETMLQEARSRSVGVILAQCSLDTRSEWAREAKRLLIELESLHYPERGEEQ